MSESIKNEFIQNLLTTLGDRLSNEDDVNAFVENFVDAYVNPASARYNDDFLLDIIKPALISFIRFKDDTAKELRYFKNFLSEKGCANEGTDYAIEILENVLVGVDDILAGYDVQPFRCEDAKFNPRRQSVVKKIATNDPAKIKTVAESLSNGYERKGFVISKERIAAYAEIKAETNTVEGE